jgi:hypothetical protein
MYVGQSGEEFKGRGRYVLKGAKDCTSSNRR